MNGVLAAAAGPESVGPRLEPRFPLRLQRVHDLCLVASIDDYGVAEAFFATLKTLLTCMERGQCGQSAAERGRCSQLVVRSRLWLSCFSVAIWRRTRLAWPDPGERSCPADLAALDMLLSGHEWLWPLVEGW